MAETAIFYDATKCTACRGCQAACKEWNDLKADKTVNTGSYENPPDLTPRTWLKIRFNEVETENGLAWLFTRQACMHCTDAGCVKVCPTKAVFHHDLGFVGYNKEICTGCGYCVDACPFNVPRLEGNTVTGKKLMHKCVYCIDRVTNGQEPACVKTCPPKALTFGDRSDMIAAADERIAKLSEQGITANLYGRNELSGLHVMYLLTNPAADYKLPAKPEVSPSVTLWEDILHPVGYGVVGLVAAGLAMNYFVARARMVKEKEGK